MTVLDGIATFGMEASRALGERLADSPVMAALRREAAAAASVLPWPDSYKERPWKYWDPTRIKLDGYRPVFAAVTNKSGALHSCPVTGEHAAVLAQENSETVFTEEAPGGLTLLPFEAIDQEETQRIIDEHLGKAVPFDRSKFTALHYAFQRGGVLVHVAPNTELTLPVRILRSYPSEGQLAAPHTLIVTGANSRVNIVEEYRSGEGDILAIPAVEIFPGPGAEVRYTAIHRWGGDTRVFSEQRMVAERDSALIGTNVAVGGKVVKGHIESSLIGRGSSSVLYGLAFGTGSQHIDFYTLQDHIGADTRSDLLFKSALKDKSRAVYYGQTRVNLEARNADANQENRNLLLSPTAKADSDPVLEILTSDILRCSHGATAGPVDQEQLFYLQARGIPYAAAEALLVRAFLGQVLDRVPDEALRDELAAALDARLG
jgi:Fe-S cluster assembly protein SufD